MVRSTDQPRDCVSDRERQWQARQDAFATTQSDFRTEREAYRTQSLYLQQLRLHYEQERQVYQQEQERLWQDLKERRRRRGEDDQPIHTEQYLRQMMEDFSASLAIRQQQLTSARQLFLNRLDALREQRMLVRELQVSTLTETCAHIILTTHLSTLLRKKPSSSPRTRTPASVRPLRVTPMLTSFAPI